MDSTSCLPLALINENNSCLESNEPADTAEKYLKELHIEMSKRNGIEFMQKYCTARIYLLEINDNQDMYFLEI